MGTHQILQQCILQSCLGLKSVHGSRVFSRPFDFNGGWEGLAADDVQFSVGCWPEEVGSADGIM